MFVSPPWSFFAERRDDLCGLVSALISASQLVTAPFWGGLADRFQGSRATLPLAKLEQLYRTLSFLSRWTAQLQDRVVQLAF